MRLQTAVIGLVTASIVASSPAVRVAGNPQPDVRQVVDATIRPLMAKEDIAGMAVGVIVDGRPYVFDYGVASKQTQQPVTGTTLFEIGSVSKTFTVTLASYAERIGDLSLSDPVSKYLPSLKGTNFGNLSLLDLATHTTGGIPLQVPGGIGSEDQLLAYLKTWQPPHAPGTYRAYSNISIGALGLAVANGMKSDFVSSMQRDVFEPLDLHDTYIAVPAAKMPDYAEGYKSDGTPIRMSNGVLWAQAYGVRTTAADLLRYVQANMNLIAVDPARQQAISNTHAGYFNAGTFTQDLIWAQYPYPVTLQRLLDGNAIEVTNDPTPVTALNPPLPPAENVLLDKTGSTNGFAAYVAFIPGKKLGVVLLANKNYPIPERVSAAYGILSSLAGAF